MENLESLLNFMGKIIGKNGLTANAIRGVMQAAGVKDKLNVSVEFLD